MKLFILLSLGLLLSCNFHVVEEGKLYRSAQPSADDIEKAVEEYGIKTIINLRGEGSSDWYIEEEQIARELDLDLINIRMRASHIPLANNLKMLFDAFDNAKRPILIHCQAGADRTGEATAIYLMEYMGKTKKEALKMLTPKYLHLKKKYPAKRYFINNYQGKEWALNEYDPCEEKWEHFPKDTYCN